MLCPKLCKQISWTTSHRWLARGPARMLEVDAPGCSRGAADGSAPGFIINSYYYA